jgi:hypothetical protein
MAAVQARALAYKKAGLSDPMHLLRVRAFTDLLTGRDARTTPASTSTGSSSRDQRRRAANGDGHRTTSSPAADQDLTDYFTSDLPDSDDGLIPDSCLHLTHPDDQDNADSDGADGSSGNGGDNDGGGTGPTPAGGNSDQGLAANVELTLPLATLLGLAQTPGEAHGLGAVDPATARRLAASTAAHPGSTYTLIITGQHGRATAFGTARPRRGKHTGPPPPGSRPPPPAHPALPANPAAGEQGQDNSGAAQPAARITKAARQPGGPDSRWDLDIAGRAMTVTIVPIPAEGQDCDHRWYTPSYQPGVTLRRLIQVRDGACAMPLCIRHPRGTDFEHTIPWPQGPSCACNGACRCRRDHRIKQSPGWTAEQHGGHHTWTTPTGRQYTKTPREYPS